MATNAKNDVVGISKQGAQKILDAITEYEKELKSRAELWFSGDAWQAIQGENTNQDFRNMTKLFMSDNEKYVNYLEQFKRKLEHIIAWYEQSDKNNNTFTSSAKSTLQS